MAGIWMDEITSSQTKSIKSVVSSGIKYCLCTVRAYISGLLFGGCLVAAVVVKLRFAEENVPAKGALGSWQDNSFTDHRSYCTDLERLGPLCEHFNSKGWKVARGPSLCWSKLSLFPWWNGRQSSWGYEALLNADISQSLKWQTLLNKLLREVCKTLLVLYVRTGTQQQKIFSCDAAGKQGVRGS